MSELDDISAAVTSIVCNETGRFAHIFFVNSEVRLRYGKDTGHGIVVPNITEQQAIDLGCFWLEGVDSEDMDYAIEML